MKHPTPEASGKVLIVSADSSLSQRVGTPLHQCGLELGRASTGEEALMHLRRDDYDAVLLDLDLPRLSGVMTCSRIRQEFPNVWIVAMTVDDNTRDGIAALDAGADHYLSGPLPVRELAARIRAIARRLRISVNKSTGPIEVGIFRLDRAQRTFAKNGSAVPLTETEFALIYQLMACAGQPVFYSTLLDILWGQHGPKERGYLRIYISQLRRKIESVPSQPRFLLTHMSVGYKFVCPADVSDPTIAMSTPRASLVNA